MDPDLLALGRTTAFFVLGHFILSSLPVRTVIAGRIGAGPFMAIYSVLAGATLFWTISLYGEAPYVELWAPTPALAMIPHAAMPFAAILIVCSVTTRMATAVGGDRAADDPVPVRGIMTVTRHPMLCGATLWSLSHIAANGDVASVILMGGILILSVGGMVHIDHRRAKTMGSAWGPIALSTSVVPFLAALQGRAKIDWAGIGLWRLAVGLVIYAGLVVAHPWFAGVSVVPH